jgi:hypothetical protein
VVSVKLFYIPLTRVQGWDGKAIWLSVTDEEVVEQYRKDKRPDPYVYHYSPAQQTEMSDSVTDFQLNMRRIDRVYVDEEPFVTAEEPPAEEPVTFSCDLCEEKFRSESELDAHVSNTH